MGAFAAIEGSLQRQRRPRPAVSCSDCGAVFEVLPERCPVCRRRRKKQVTEERHAARRRRRNARGKISKAKRAAVYLRDGYRCLACGATGGLTLDHVVPLSKDGTNDIENLQTLCVGCNCSRKRGKIIDYRAALM